MIRLVKLKINSFIQSDSERSRKVIKNVIVSFGAKGGSILIGLLLVPIIINYINPLQYGIWLTVSSIVNWMGFFDIGLSNGLRNKLANSLANNNLEDSQKYVSTSYFILLIVSLLLFVLTLAINPYINWNYLLNVPLAVTDNISLITSVVLCSFCVQFVIQLINTVLTATHDSGKVSLIFFSGQLAILASVIFLKQILPASFAGLVFTLSFMPILVSLIASIYFYRTKLKYLAPSFKKIKLRYAKSIVNIGFSFFAIQICAVVLFQTDNIIITSLIGPEAVTEFNISYKLFSVFPMILMIAITPYWSAFTDAFAKQDFEWMKKSMKIMHKLWLILAIGSVIIFCLSPWIYNIWVGKQISTSPQLSLAMTVYVIAFMWQTIHAYFLNGLGKIRIQLILVLLSAVANIPLAIFLGKQIGLAGIISANTAVFLVIGIVLSIQTKKIINNKANGIWAI